LRESLTDTNIANALTERRFNGNIGPIDHGLMASRMTTLSPRTMRTSIQQVECPT
jgi:hypothetical protein